MSHMETSALQIAVAIASMVPIIAGGAGVALGPAMLGAESGAAADLDGHYRYLSGLLLGIGVAFAATVPQIAAHQRRFGLLTVLVVTGGVGRLISLVEVGAPSPVMMAALAMELVVAPGLAVWQRRVARLAVRIP